MVVLITGGAGFIGSHIAEALLNKGVYVRILDNLSTGRRENLPSSAHRLELIEGDIRDIDTCRRATRGVTQVFHHAAFTSIPSSVKDPLLNNDINITGTLNMLMAAKESGVDRFIFASSCAVYGDPGCTSTSAEPSTQGDDTIQPLAESTKPRPLSPYAVSKLVGEEYCRVFSHLYNLKTVSMRYFNVFGPKQDPSSEYAAVIPKFINSLLNGRNPTIFGDGNQTRDFIFVKDVVRANLLASTADNAAGMVFNIASGRRVNLHELLRELANITGEHLPPHHTDARPGDIRHSWADISRAALYLKFTPAFSLHEGLTHTVAWIKKGTGYFFEDFSSKKGHSQ